MRLPAGVGEKWSGVELFFGGLGWAWIPSDSVWSSGLEDREASFNVAFVENGLICCVKIALDWVAQTGI